VRDAPRIALGLIRLTNGLTALLAPGFLAERLGRSGDRTSSAHYLLRMFGIRTVFLGLDLLTQDTERRQEALRRAPIIHASDVLAALAAGASRQLPFRAAAAALGISCVNLWLAIVAQPSEGRDSPPQD
jgi:uncharacterized protein YjeT (DUF2065 family)